MINTLFFGGAFNPPTIAHIELAKFALKELNFDKVIFCPTKNHYILKTEGKSYSFSELTRLNMLNKIAKNNSFMEISDYELKQDKQPRTYFTLKHFKEEGYNIKLLIGSDWLNKLDSSWLYVKEIAKEFGIVVLTRSNDNIDEIIKNNKLVNEIKDYLTILKTPPEYKFISSTYIRSLLNDYNNNVDEINSLIPKELDGLKDYLKEKHVMKNRFIKVGSAIPNLKISNVKYNKNEILKLVDLNKDCSIIVFPELSLTGYTCGDLFFQDYILEETKNALIELKDSIKDNLVIVGAPLIKNNKLYNCAVFIENGKILGVVPKINIPNYQEFYEGRWFTSGKDIKNQTITINNLEVPFGIDLLFKDDNNNAIVGAEICEDLFVPNKPSIQLALNGANIICNLSASPENILKKEYRKQLISTHSSSLYSVYIYTSSCIDESSTDLVFSGHSLIYNSGKLLNESIYKKDIVNTAIIDLDSIIYNRMHQSTFSNIINEYRYIDVKINSLCNTYNLDYSLLKDKLEKENYLINKNPFLPTSEEDKNIRFKEIIDIQKYGLYTRLTNAHINNIVIGVSGGLDSTLALIIAYEVRKLNKNINIFAITMPKGGNTSSTTLNNSINLIKSLNINPIVIPIEDTLKSHLKDINHEDKYLGNGDVTYENAQARIRTLILMDYANKENGIVLGTGDLSELALGWCTYNGDHMSMYNVNGSIPKTLIKYIVEYYALNSENKLLKDTLLSIVSTPISPELTPSKNDNINQKTEDLIGNYDLNDFILYYYLRYGYNPTKIFLLASLAYKNISKEELKVYFIRFYNRFFKQAFKRSALPDGAKVGTISLSPRGDYRMPSDADVSSFIKEIESL